MSYKNFIFTAILVLVSIGITLVLGEGFLRLKNSTMRNYDIEMWKYSKVLKRKSDNPILGHEHIPSKSAILQSVEIRINKHGLRGRNIGHKQLGKKRILFLGSSITLGWGVPEEETMPERIDQMFKNDGKPAEILNAGIGNYNSTRYVERFLGHLTHLDPDVLVVGKVPLSVEIEQCLTPL
ncbi:MAG: hypothetical protein H8E32_07260 [Nitrospinae bacterium]|nr:hypothetical protein [Nitrospinota bacterium]